MRNLALWLAYDGTDFVGSQWQNTGRSVQGELEGAWSRFAQEQRRFTMSGRTDAGVHARGQVANVRTETNHALATIKRGLNAVLPDDVSVLDVREVPLDFHARHSAVRRSYRYLIDNNQAPLPMLRYYTLHIEQQLDVDAMREALALLIGKHDFAAFAAINPEQRSTVRTCYQADCSIVEWLGQPLLALDLSANAFLHHMVRVIVGTVLLVGRGRVKPAAFGEILVSADRRRAGPTAAPQGLTLISVEYPSEALGI